MSANTIAPVSIGFITSPVVEGVLAGKSELRRSLEESSLPTGVSTHSLRPNLLPPERHALAAHEYVRDRSSSVTQS
jgi:hypothetical protein